MAEPETKKLIVSMEIEIPANMDAYFIQEYIRGKVFVEGWCGAFATNYIKVANFKLSRFPQAPANSSEIPNSSAKPEPELMICPKSKECVLQGCPHGVPHKKISNETGLNNCNRVGKCGGSTVCIPYVKPAEPASKRPASEQSFRIFRSELDALVSSLKESGYDGELKMIWALMVPERDLSIQGQSPLDQVYEKYKHLDILLGDPGACGKTPVWEMIGEMYRAIKAARGGE